MSDRHSWRFTDSSPRFARLQRTLNRWLHGEAGVSHHVPTMREEHQPRRGPLITLATFGLALGVVLGIILAVPLSASATIVPGSPSPVTVNAPRAISYQSDVLTEQAQEAAANRPENVEPVIDREAPQRQRQAMEQALQRVTEIRSSDTLSKDERVQQLTTLSTLPISETIALQIVELDPERWQVVSDESRRIYDEVWQNRTEGYSEAEMQNVRQGRVPYIVAPSLNPAQRNLVIYLVNSFLKPNRTINQRVTELRRQAAREAVKPVVVTINKGENIVREGDVVSPEAYEKLTKLGLVFGAGGAVALLQKFLLGLLAAWLFATYLYRYQSALWRNRRGLAVIGLVIATTVLAGRLLVPIWAPAPYVFPLAAAAVLLTVLFDGRIGLFAALMIAPLVGMQTEQSVGLTVTLALGSAAGVFVAQRAVRSIWFLWVGLAVALLTMLSAFVFWLEPINEWPAWLGIPLLSLGNGIASAILAFGTYYMLGRAANVVTPLQLMELAHPNHPLLHRLMREAPGTYHHSIVVSNLAEFAAENIGADPLLARVGAYYHDVGKILRPYFFTDNQHERSNVHDVLDPKTSARIIIDHVREGIKLAQEHGLPQPVIDFIAQHHGTNLVSFFYQRALQEDDEANIEEFRYPGPKPQTRETGIMMLADGVEATVRARSQSGKLRPARPDEDETRSRDGMQSIAEVVDQIVNERVRSGQLDESPLTLRDIAVIKESFVKTLQGIYHPRVDYPRQPQPASEPATVP